MRTTDMIATKRDGGENSTAEIGELVAGYVRGEVPDYQVAAWLMAAYLRGLTEAETAHLTMQMAGSGEMLDLSTLPAPRVDKHSTGGVGDKTSLVVVPLLASCGCTVVKMSGRGLGITGGTVDKLESIPGFRAALAPEEMLAVALRAGCCLAGQSERLAPADKLLYALRDATATIESIPLITASIMSKKLAAGADVISLDIKCGSGAFMDTLERARDLAASLLRVGRAAGKRVSATITDMSAPLGNAVGNLLEVREAVDTLNGQGPPRFVELCLALTAETLVTAGLSPDLAAAHALAASRLANGSARDRFATLLECQGASRAILDSPSLLPISVSPVAVCADSGGWVAAIDAGVVGRAVLDLGAGRARKEDAIDPSVGIVLQTTVGSRLSADQPLALVYARTAPAAEAASEALRRAVRLVPEPVPVPPVVLETISE